MLVNQRRHMTGPLTGALRPPTWMSCCADTLCAPLLSAAIALFEGRKRVACSALLLNWETSPAACALHLGHKAPRKAKLLHPFCDCSSQHLLPLPQQAG